MNLPDTPDPTDLHYRVNQRLAQAGAKSAFDMTYDEAIAEVVRLRSANAFLIERNIALTKVNNKLRGQAIERGDAL